MIDLSIRSYKKELLDQADIPFADIKRNMQELEMINSKLGGHKITISGLRKIIKNLSLSNETHIAEVGCGGGDNLKVINVFCRKNKISVRLTGVDINPECIEFARSKKENEGINFITSDYRKTIFNKNPDIIFSSLFCHHFSNEEIIEMLKWMNKNSTSGFFINDLHRHWLAYYSIKWLTNFFSKSYLVKNDAPLSVQKGFKRKEWKNLFQQAGITNFTIQWKWAFRWLIIANK